MDSIKALETSSLVLFRHVLKSCPTLTTIPNENKSEGFSIGPSAWDSGLRHMKLPICLPMMAASSGTCAESSKSASLTSVISPSCRWMRMLLGLTSAVCHSLVNTLNPSGCRFSSLTGVNNILIVHCGKST